MADIELNVPRLPDGRYFGEPGYRKVDGLEVIGNITFVKTGGRIYSTGRSRSLAGSYNMNDKVRRAWCRLSGVKLADLKLAIKEHHERAAEARQSDHFAHVEEQAHALGYRLVKRDE